MEREKIAKDINRYVRKKILIISTLLLFIVAMIIFVILAQFIKYDFLAYGAIISYACMIVMLLIACKFDLNKKLAKSITKEDYIEILNYISKMEKDTSELKYYESILMIKRTLDEMVYYHMNEIDEVFRDYLCYLQSFLKDDSNKQMVSSKALDRQYLKTVCNKLLEQIEQGKIKRLELDDLAVDKELGKRRFYNTTVLFSGLCNGILIVLVLAKVIITVEPDWFEYINASPFWRIPYNTGIDIIAAVLAMIALKEKR